MPGAVCLWHFGIGYYILYNKIVSVIKIVRENNLIKEGDCDEKDYFEIYSNHSWRDFDVIFVRMLSKQIRD